MGEAVPSKGGRSPSRKPPSKKAAVLTAGVGGTGGGAIALLAQSVREPYRTWISVIAPTLAAGFTAWWPRLVAWNERRVERDAPRLERRRIVREIDDYIAGQRRRLKKDRTLSPDLRKTIEVQVAKAQDMRAKVEFRLVSRHLAEKAEGESPAAPSE